MYCAERTDQSSFSIHVNFKWKPANCKLVERFDRATKRIDSISFFDNMISLASVEVEQFIFVLMAFVTDTLLECINFAKGIVKQSRGRGRISGCHGLPFQSSAFEFSFDEIRTDSQVKICEGEICYFAHLLEQVMKYLP